MMNEGSGRLSASIGEMLERSSGNRLEAIRQPVEIRNMEGIADNMNTTKTNAKKTSNKKQKVAAKPVEAPATVAAPAGTGASRAIVTGLLAQLLGETKVAVAATGGTKKEQAAVEKTMKKAERKILTLDTVERNGAQVLRLEAPFAGGFLKLATEANIERDFVKAEGCTYIPVAQKKALLKVLRSVWSYGGSILVVDGAAPEMLPRHDEAVAEFKASKNA
jgi:hypothetical protein